MFRLASICRKFEVRWFEMQRTGAQSMLVSSTLEEIGYTAQSLGNGKLSCNEVLLNPVICVRYLKIGNLHMSVDHVCVLRLACSTPNLPHTSVCTFPKLHSSHAFKKFQVEYHETSTGSVTGVKYTLTPHAQLTAGTLGAMVSAAFAAISTSAFHLLRLPL